MAEKKVEKCGHPGCNCPAEKGTSIAATIARALASSHPSPAGAVMGRVLPARRRVQRDRRRGTEILQSAVKVQSSIGPTLAKFGTRGHGFCMRVRHIVWVPDLVEVNTTRFPSAETEWKISGAASCVSRCGCPMALPRFASRAKLQTSRLNVRLAKATRGGEP